MDQVQTILKNIRYANIATVKINEADNSKILGLYNSFTTVFKLKEEDVTGDAPTRFYSAKPLRIWINGESERNGKYIDVREEVL